MAIKIEAITSIIEWDAELGKMSILNPGDVAEVGDSLAKAKLAEKSAKKTKKSIGEASPAADEVESADEPVEEQGAVQVDDTAEADADAEDEGAPV